MKGEGVVVGTGERGRKGKVLMVWGGCWGLGGRERRIMCGVEGRGRLGGRGGRVERGLVRLLQYSRDIKNI